MSNVFIWVLLTFLLTRDSLSLRYLWWQWEIGVYTLSQDILYLLYICGDSETFGCFKPSRHFLSRDSLSLIYLWWQWEEERLRSSWCQMAVMGSAYLAVPFSSPLFYFARFLKKKITLFKNGCHGQCISSCCPLPFYSVFFRKKIIFQSLFLLFKHCTTAPGYWLFNLSYLSS